MSLPSPASPSTREREREWEVSLSISLIPSLKCCWYLIWRWKVESRQHKCGLKVISGVKVVSRVGESLIWSWSCNNLLPACLLDIPGIVCMDLTCHWPDNCIETWQLGYHSTLSPTSLTATTTRNTDKDKESLRLKVWQLTWLD